MSRRDGDYMDSDSEGDDVALIDDEDYAGPSSRTGPSTKGKSKATTTHPKRSRDKGKGKAKDVITAFP